MTKLSGTPSIDLAENCPDARTSFPRTPCTSMGCEWRVRDPAFLNCSFAVGASGPHSFVAIGRMMGISTQAAQQTAERALKKLESRGAIRDILPARGPRVAQLQLLRRPDREGGGGATAHGEEPVGQDEGPGLQALRR